MMMMMEVSLVFTSPLSLPDDGDDDDSACDGGCCDKGRGVSIFMIGLCSMAVLIVTVEVVTAGLRRLLFKMSSTCRSARNVTNCLYRSYIDEWMDGWVDEWIDGWIDG